MVSKTKDAIDFQRGCPCCDDRYDAEMEAAREELNRLEHGRDQTKAGHGANYGNSTVAEWTTEVNKQKKIIKALQARRKNHTNHADS